MSEKHNLLFLNDSESENYDASSMLKMEELSINATFETHPGNALDYLRSLNADKFPDAIVVDVNMPIMTGLEWAECYLLEFYYHHPKTVLYMISTTPKMSKLNELADNPVIADFLPKPFTKELFYNKVYSQMAKTTAGAMS